MLLQVADQLRSSQEPTTPTDLKSCPILSESYLEDTDDDDLTASVAELSLYTEANPGASSSAGDSAGGSVHSGVTVGGLTLAEWTSTGALGTKHFSGPVYVFSRYINCTTKKRYFLLDLQIARPFLPYSEYLYHPSSLLCNLYN